MRQRLWRPTNMAVAVMSKGAYVLRVTWQEKFMVGVLRPIVTLCNKIAAQSSSSGYRAHWKPGGKKRRAISLTRDSAHKFLGVIERSRLWDFRPYHFL